MSACIIDKYLTNIINNDLLRNSFSNSAKVASVRPIFKKGERTEIKNYKPVFYIVFPKSMKGSYITKSHLFQMNFLSDFISAYRKENSTNHVLIRLIENWKATLDKNLFTRAVLMDLPKAFDGIPHDFLNTKLHVSTWSLF